MSEELQMITEDAEDGMKKAISHLEVELTKIRAGKANPSMLDGFTHAYCAGGQYQCTGCENHQYPAMGEKYVKGY